ncbi:ribonuclease T2 [Gouania willdenowi]|uniref:Uncharacterized protein n=1 Tax=Gouania willdenowi TaxID=441366 RepID=A0A8C5FZI9_GOUWI|nr:ribonuclease T2 [Gouania willdenowi]
MRRYVLILVCLAVATSSAFVISHPNTWTKLILTHSWPSTFCSMEHCHPNISYWTLHGLWPNKGQACNSSWHFNSSEIEDLLPDMLKSWPDLKNPTSTTFWKHEWDKHGTCAARVESMNSQYKYFAKALELYHKLDLYSVLQKFDIIPSEKNYNLSQIEGVIENFYGIKPKIQCLHPSKEPVTQILGQIEICFQPDFTPADCTKELSVEDKATVGDVNASELSVCSHTVPVYYPPHTFMKYKGTN